MTINEMMIATLQDPGCTLFHSDLERAVACRVAWPLYGTIQRLAGLTNLGGAVRDTVLDLRRYCRESI